MYVYAVVACYFFLFALTQDTMVKCVTVRRALQRQSVLINERTGVRVIPASQIGPDTSRQVSWEVFSSQGMESAGKELSKEGRESAKRKGSQPARREGD